LEEFVNSQEYNVRISDREREILSLIGQFYDYGIISEKLGISRRTLHKHIEHISKKIGLPQRIGGRVQQDIIKYAIEHGYGKQQNVAL
jgi:DNA-binding CsgD family transcriptional regulator